MSTQSDLHNELAPKIIEMIVKRVGKTSGNPMDMLKIVESVTAAIVILAAVPGTQDKAIEELCAGIKERVRLMLLLEQTPGGNA